MALEMLFTMGTAVPATPFTVVTKLLAVLVFDTIFTAGAVATTPFTVLVKVFVPLLTKVLLVAAVVLTATQSVPLY